MKLRTTVDMNLPEPARQLLTIVRSLSKATKQISETHIHEGHVRVNGKIRTQPFFRVEVGDLIEMEYERPTERSPRDKKSGIRVFDCLYEDDQIIVVNKPPNLLTVPTPYKEKNTLISQVERYLSKQGGDQKAFCVHRLDRGVSGVLVFAKSLEMAERLREQFAARKPTRQYIAIVAGVLDQARGTMQSYLATDADLNQYSTDDAAQGQLAITHFRVVERWATATMVEVSLETGRRNQIRVHFAEAGHPVLGDPRYQRQQAVHSCWQFDRMALHAESLSILHPESKQQLEWRTSWPEEFRSFRRRISNN